MNRAIAGLAAVLYFCAAICAIGPLLADSNHLDVSVPDVSLPRVHRFPADCVFTTEDFRHLYDPAGQPYAVARIRRDDRPDRENLAFGNNLLGLSSKLPSIPFAIGEPSESRCSHTPF